MEGRMSNDTDKLAEALKQQIEKFRQTFKLPDMDTSALIENQRKTIDAMSRAAQLSNQTATEISQRQLEIPRSTAEHVATMVPQRKALQDPQLTNAHPAEISNQHCLSATFATSLSVTSPLSRPYI
jgi:hypothetical protein